MTLSTFLAFTTYRFTRSNVVQQRDRNSVDAARLHAATVQALLAGNPLSTRAAIAAPRGVRRRSAASSGTSDARVAARRRYDFDARCPQVAPRPGDERRGAGADDDPRRERTHDRRRLATPGDNAYFEFFSLDEVNTTLESIRLSLFFAGIITTGLGVLLGVFAAQSRRATRRASPPRRPRRSPVGVSTRASNRPTTPTSACSPTRSTTWRRPCSSASSATPDSRRDVSHELRSPLMTLAAVDRGDGGPARRDARACAGRARSPESAT